MSSKNINRKRKNDVIDLVRRVRTHSSDYGLNIMWLDNKPLQKIFSYTSLADLGALRKSCKRFNHLAITVVKAKYWPQSEGSWYKFPKSNLKFEEIAQLMENFGDIFIDVVLTFAGAETKQETRNYFSLLKYCTSLRNLHIKNVNLNLLSINQIKYKTLTNLEQLCFGKCTSVEANYQIILNTCDPLKLKVLAFDSECTGISDDMLAFVSERMDKIVTLDVNVDDNTQLFADNLSKLRNLKQLEFIRMQCIDVPFILLLNSLTNIGSLTYLHLYYNKTNQNQCFNDKIQLFAENVLQDITKLRQIHVEIQWNNAPIAPLINASAQIESLEKLYIVCKKINQNKDIVKAINKLKNVQMFTLVTDTKIPDFMKVTTFKHEHVSGQSFPRYYTFTQL